MGQEGELEVELLLNRRTVRGVTRYLVRWRGRASADDEWLRLEELAHCPAKVAEYDAMSPRPRAAARAMPPADIMMRQHRLPLRQSSRPRRCRRRRPVSDWRSRPRL